MGAYGAGAQKEPFGHLGAGQAPGYERENLQLASLSSPIAPEGRESGAAWEGGRPNSAVTLCASAAAPCKENSSPSAQAVLNASSPSARRAVANARSFLACRAGAG